MKNLKVLGLSILFFLLVSGCGAEEPTGSGSGVEENTIGAKPVEPSAETVCAFCNMEIYHKDHEMGVFSAQAITEQDEHLFFDDSGCILNYERKTGEELTEKWVRDYLTSEWLKVDATTPVKSDLKTPMKYGYSFFENEEKAKEFIENNQNLNPALTDWESIDEVANERYKKKMKMQNDNN
jgi:copper chaperone NosL